MDYLGLINGDNVFKYSFTLGLVMLVFALIYPLEKKHLIELEINTHNKEAELLNYEIRRLSKDLLKLEKESKALMKQADAFQDSQNLNKAETIRRVAKFNSDFKILQATKQNLETKNIVLEYNKKRILTLESQSSTFGCFSSIMILCGIALTFFGFYNWVSNTFKDIKEKVKK